jgi:putative transposase
MLQSYKYRMYPSEEQVALLMQHIHACRFVYNTSLEQKIRAYEQEGRKLSCFDLNTRLPALKEEHPWLKEANSQSLQSANKNLDNAFTRFFREKKGFPRFKSKKNPVQSFQVPQHYHVDFDQRRIKFPKIGEVKTVFHRVFAGKMKYATISATSTGKWSVSILVDDEKPEPEPAPFSLDTTLGIDVGLKDFATLSTGEKIENPRYLKISLQRLKVLQQRVSRKVKGSKNREKAILRLARCHEKIVNQRNDFLHKISNRFVSENQAIAVESLNVGGMMKNHHRTGDWGCFVVRVLHDAGIHVPEVREDPPEDREIRSLLEDLQQMWVSQTGSHAFRQRMDLP